MTDTGQVPGEGQPENAGAVEQRPGVPGGGAYTFLTPSGLTPSGQLHEDDDQLLMPGAQGAWSDPQTLALQHGPQSGQVRVPEQYTAVPDGQPPVAPDAVPAPELAAPTDLGAPAVPAPPAAPPVGTAAPMPPVARRPLHMGPPLPDSTGGVVRSLADRGPAGVAPHPLTARSAPPAPPVAEEQITEQIPQEEPVLPGPQLGEIPPQPGAPWGPPQAGGAVPEAPVPAAVEEPAVVEPAVVEPVAPVEPVAAVEEPAEETVAVEPAAPVAEAVPAEVVVEPVAPVTQEAVAPEAVAPAPEEAAGPVAVEPVPEQPAEQVPVEVVPQVVEPVEQQVEPEAVPQQAEVPVAPVAVVEAVAVEAPEGVAPEAVEVAEAAEVVVPVEAEQVEQPAQAVVVEQAETVEPPVDVAVPEAVPAVEPVPEQPAEQVPVEVVPQAVESVEQQVEQEAVPQQAEVPVAPVAVVEAVAVEAPEGVAPEAVEVAEAAEVVVPVEAEQPVPQEQPGVAPEPVAEVPAVDAPVQEPSLQEPPVQESAAQESAVQESAPLPAEELPEAVAAVAAPEQATAPEAAPVAVPAEPVTPVVPVPAADAPEAPVAPEAVLPPEAPAAPEAVPEQEPVPEQEAVAEAGPVPQETVPQESAPEAGPTAETDGPEAAAPARGAPAPGYDDAEREAVLRVMRERRDIRNGFRSDPIPHEVLLRVLEAAHTAPSVGHSQPWDFVVIRSAETRSTMHELAQRQRDAYAKTLPKGRAKQFKELKIEAILETPVNIVVTADPTRGGRHTLGRHTQPQMAPYSSALAVENLWLAARAEGLGVGWVSFFDEREMVRALGLPEHLEVVAYLCVGYVDEFPEDPELMQAGWSRRRPLSWVVHEETYGRRALPGEEPHDLLQETVANIRPLDAKALGEAWERQKRMTKPAGALGMLEIISAQLSGLSRMCPPPIPEPAAVAIFAGDHGVHAQGVTSWPQEVTAQMVANFLGGGAVCNAFAHQVGAEVCVIDVGVATDLPATPGLLPRKVRPGTADFTTGPALTREEALAAIEVGIETARDLVAAGNRALLTGEMGIANTTVSAALISVFTGVDPSEITGRGTGINDETHARKVDVVRRALELHAPDPADPVGVLAAVGGLEHAALVGLILGGASLRTPVVLDGVSAGAAALVARAIAPEALAACIAGHRSAEPGHVAALNKLGLRPLVDLDLRLGEGTGALLSLPLIQSAARAMHEVATFDSAGVTEK
ncbi:nicotinate-nucleotide--dimethylbenzimidazole phosphoribosyltransferase [Streptomyces sp. NPDC000594]|uniref:nicotinate-nucleotide--dimethylbenzimidazole phosphoribosyltransferase n=1 Tax=Streptomyces sp. NPDC000594 TaxID=3154261 RepID=UPI003316516A